MLRCVRPFVPRQNIHSSRRAASDMVMDHKRSPRHFGTLRAPAHQARGYNPSCGDDLQMTLNVAQGQVQNIRFGGQGCAICIASASMMAYS